MLKRFLKCGIFGWCIEILWTAFESFRRRQMQLKGNTSIWMFPIYGMAVLLGPMSRNLSDKKAWMRGSIYMICIFLFEYLTGTLLKKYNCCPWDYSKVKYNINGVIRMDFAPLWFIIGLCFEKMVIQTKRDKMN